MSAIWAIYYAFHFTQSTYSIELPERFAGVICHRTVAKQRFIRGLPRTTAKQVSLTVTLLKCVCLRHCWLIGQAMTLTSDLWPLKPFQQRPALTWWIFVPNVIGMRLLNKELSHHSKYVLTDKGRTAGRPKNITPPQPIVGGGLKITWVETTHCCEHDWCHIRGPDLQRNLR